MLLSRLILVPVLIAGVLPCVAQTPLPKPSMESVPFAIQSSPCMVGGPKSPADAALLKKKLCAKLNEQKQAAIKGHFAEKNSACYSIRDYQFAIRSGSVIAKLKGYSTCERASLFKMQEVTASKR